MCIKYSEAQVNVQVRRMVAAELFVDAEPGLGLSRRKMRMGE